jgi:hypothetical protein
MNLWVELEDYGVRVRREAPMLILNDPLGATMAGLDRTTPR